jgi:nitrogen regulatory protein P-II 1
MLRKIECYISRDSKEHMLKILSRHHLDGMTAWEVTGFKNLDAGSGITPETEDRLKMEIVVDEGVVEDLLRDLKLGFNTGTGGEGKIFVIPVEDAIRLSTRETGRSAVS